MHAGVEIRPHLAKAAYQQSVTMKVDHLVKILNCDFRDDALIPYFNRCAVMCFYLTKCALLQVKDRLALHLPHNTRVCSYLFKGTCVCVYKYIFVCVYVCVCGLNSMDARLGVESYVRMQVYIYVRMHVVCLQLCTYVFV